MFVNGNVQHCTHPCGIHNHGGIIQFYVCFRCQPHGSNPRPPSCQEYHGRATAEVSVCSAMGGPGAFNVIYLSGQTVGWCFCDLPNSPKPDECLTL